MKEHNDYEPKRYKLTCKDLEYNGVVCCDMCHDPLLAEYDLRVVKIDGIDCLVCCALAAFFYPKDPSKGISPEEKLLRAIFGETMIHEAAEKYIRVDEEDD